MHRLFVAIDFPSAVRAQLAMLCSGLPHARWVPEEQMHLTLRFVGEVEGGAFLDIREGLGAVQAPAFEMALKGIGHFPPRGRPTVLWAGVRDEGGLLRLQSRVEKAVMSAGLPPETRNFSPHVTLARLKGTPPRRVADYLGHHALFSAGPFPVEAFHLYSSVLTPKGALHRIEASYPLDSSSSPQ